MPSLIEQGLDKIVAQAFAGRLYMGRLRRENPSTVDSLGDPVQVTPSFFDFNGIRDNLSAFYAAQAGIPLTDVKILILLGSITVVPREQDKVFIRGQWHELRKLVKQDPANATQEWAAFEITAP